MKRVTFKVAKALKEAGYPQESTEGIVSLSRYSSETHSFILIPFVMEAWLWLWREKRLWLQVRHIGSCNWFKCWVTDAQDYDDPEEAIEQAIKYLVENDLIK